MRITHLRMVDASGTAPGLRRGFVRVLVSIVSAIAILLGYLLGDLGSREADLA